MEVSWNIEFSIPQKGGWDTNLQKNVVLKVNFKEMLADYIYPVYPI